MTSTWSPTVTCTSTTVEATHYWDRFRCSFRQSSFRTPGPRRTTPCLNWVEANQFERICGAEEILPRVHLIPTPGHTAGDQSLVVQQSGGSIVVAGQSHGTATQYAAEQLAWRAHHDHHDGSVPEIPEWIDTLQRFDPRIVYFAHDHSVWMP